MAAYSGPEIVNSGLMLHLDAANPRSYLGTGTTWTDLSGRNNTGTLTNGPTFNGSNKGSIVFDGTDDFIDLQNKDDLTIDNFSYSCWYYPTSFNSLGLNTIFSRENARHYIGFTGSGQYQIFLRGNLWSTNGQFEGTIGNSGVVILNSWQYVTVFINWANSSFSVFHNGNLIWNYTNVLLGTSFVNTTIKDAVLGSRYQGGTSNKIIGRIANFTYYNKILSPAEVQQNFEATRDRYGI